MEVGVPLVRIMWGEVDNLVGDHEAQCLPTKSIVEGKNSAQDARYVRGIFDKK